MRTDCIDSSSLTEFRVARLRRIVVPSGTRTKGVRE